MKRHSQSRGVGSAFTLIELLVVIAIIAILAAILFPVFAKAREKARQTACLSNAKQIGLAFVQYTSDYDELYPNGTYKFAPIGGWANQIYPYVKSTSAFLCPDDAVAYNTAAGATLENPSDFAMNANIGRSGNLAASPQVPNVAWGQADFNAVAKTVLLFEVQGNKSVNIAKTLEDFFPNAPGTNSTSNGSPRGNGFPQANQPNGGGTTNGSCATPGTLKAATGYMGRRDYSAWACEYTAPDGIHSDGSNFVLADGHAKWMRGAAVSTGTNSFKSDPLSKQIVQTTGNQAAGTAGTYEDGVTMPAATFSIY